MTTVVKLTEAKDLIKYSEIRLYTPLGGTYVALLTNLSVEDDKVTMWVTTLDGADLPSLTCAPDTGIEVVLIPNLSLRGRVETFIKMERHHYPAADYECASAAGLLDDLEALLDTIKE